MTNADVHQGSVLSLLLFSVLMNKLIDKLVACGFGYRVFVGCYFDDIVLRPCASCTMQKMLDVCNEEIVLLDLKLNENKLVVLYVGPR